MSLPQIVTAKAKILLAATMHLILHVFISKRVDQFMMISGALLGKRNTRRSKTETLHSRNLKMNSIK